jgi:DNA modification methylase
MKPYFKKGNIAIYHGDSREILPTIKCDVIVTDPPYGVELGSKKESDKKPRYIGLHASRRPCR